MSSSNQILFFDTETTGFLVNQVYDHPLQPHIVQIAALLVNADTRETVKRLNLIAKPNGWTIPEAAMKVHGITMEYATENGRSEKYILKRFIRLWHRAESRVAHNEVFDAQIVRVAQMRFKHDELTLEDWRTGKSECTQMLATPVLQLPPTEAMVRAGYTKHKSPKLEEAHSALLGFVFANPHDALTDTVACKDIYFALKDLELYGIDVEAPLWIQVLAARINRITEWNVEESSKWITFYGKKRKLKICKQDGSIYSDHKCLIEALRLECISAKYREM